MRALNGTVLILAAAAVSPLVSPRSAVAARNKDTDLILAELRQLQAQVTQLQRTQGELERLLNHVLSRTDSEESSVRQTLVDAQTTLGEIEENVSVLSSRLDETNSRIGNMQRELASLRQTQQPLVLFPEEGEPTGGGSLPQPGSDESKSDEATVPPPVAAAAPSAVEIYNQAYTDFTHSRYPLAVSGFEEVIRRYPESDLADNSQYWIGECHMAQRRYEDALRAFEAVLRNYPDSNKLAEAGYKKATAFEALGRREDAIQQLEFVIEQYPRTQVERSASALLRKLRGYQQ